MEVMCATSRKCFQRMECAFFSPSSLSSVWNVDVMARVRAVILDLMEDT